MTKSQECKNLQLEKKPSDKLVNNRKVTHLYLNDKYLAEIKNFNGYVNLTVLYLHNNFIDKIQNLKAIPNLKSLYLQRNKIRKIENLGSLRKLQQLYLGHNEISVIENLECLKTLKELHVEKQDLIDGEKLCFDPRTLQSLSHCLQTLNISGNNITTIDMLLPLRCLRSLNASNNNLSCLKSLSENIRKLPVLLESNFSGNPVSKEHRYRETIIGKSNYLKTLDGKDITDVTRVFMKRFEIEKNNFESRDIVKFPKNITSVAKQYPLPIQKAISNFMLKPTRTLTAIDPGRPSSSEAYIPWKCMPKSFSGSNRKVPPLMRSHKLRNPCCIRNLSSLTNLV